MVTGSASTGGEETPTPIQRESLGPATTHQIIKSTLVDVDIYIQNYSSEGARRLITCTHKVKKEEYTWQS